VNKQSEIHNSHPTRIQVLLVEDNPDDADLLRKTLAEASAAQLMLTHVEWLNDALEELGEGGFDVILLDLFLPDSHGLDTFLRVYLQMPSVPIIVLIEQQDEVLAVNAIQMGAQDYLVKGQLNDGLPARVIRYAIDRHRVRMELHQCTRELQASETCFRHIIEKNVDGIVIVNQEGIIRFVNPAAEALFGRKDEELVGEMFGFPMTAGKTTEIDTIHRHGGTAAAEMRVAEIEWEGERAYVASLRDITERKQMEMELERTRQREYHLAYHDTLTDLPNRQLFFDRLHQSVALARRHGQLVSVLFLDLDGFKLVNDTFGHCAGDLLLQLVAGRLSGCLRESDTVARLGGDEFTVILNNIAHAQDAATVAQKILKALSKPFVVEGYQLVITASIGISLYPYDGEDAETLARNADTAMYRAKGRGKNSYQLYNLLMTATDLERLTLVNSWSKALERDELEIHYQPQISLSTHEMTGVEGLVRWQHPEFGPISSAKFIPIAEETGMIAPIGEWALRTVCEQNKAWQDAGFPPLRMTINLLARQFREKRLSETIDQTLADTGLNPTFLELEITESDAMQDVDDTVAKLQMLKAIGVQLSIDDFGVGYSSLSYLKQFPIDRLKIGPSFVHGIPTDRGMWRLPPRLSRWRTIWE